MSLKCSVFGHRFGDTDVTREREEDGSEVVITITETQTCERCGETRVVSENKEVTTLETPSDIVGDDLAGSDPADGAEAEPDTARTAGDVAASGRAETETADAPAPPEADDAELIDEAEPDRDSADAGGSGDSSGEADAEPTADADREQEEAAGAGTGAGAGASAGSDDAVILEDDDDGDGEERAPGQWPQELEDEPDDEWAPDTDEGELPPVEEDQPDVEPTGEAITVPEGEFHCPECGFTTPVESSSLRAGDFCPECHRGSLTHRSGE